MILDLTKPI